MVKRAISLSLYQKAKHLIPYGVNSPVRAFLSVDEPPLYVDKAKGAYIFDVDGNVYIDYISSWGAIILGHAHEGLSYEISRAIEGGTSFGLCHPFEIEFAAYIKETFPSIELLRLTTSGTEATMSSIRLARAYTGKKGIIKFRGCYHGHVDSLLVRAGSGLATYGIPDSRGILEDLAKYTFVAEFNDLYSVKKIVEKHMEEIACLIVEPVMGNMGVILPDPSFLEGIQKICRENGIVLIFDEVITGFRLTFGGAQHIFNVEPDITCLGKIIGGGFPIGGFGGKKEIMEMLAPGGDVYQAGTLSGNPVAVRAGLYVLKELMRQKNIYRNMEMYVETLKKEVHSLSEKYGIPYTMNTAKGMFTGFFTEREVRGYNDAYSSRVGLYKKFFKLMLNEGILFPPSPFEACFLTISHTAEELQRTIEAYDRVFKRMRS